VLFLIRLASVVPTPVMAGLDRASFHNVRGDGDRPVEPGHDSICTVMPLANMIGNRFEKPGLWRPLGATCSKAP
jgi:hypothetical protein